MKTENYFLPAYLDDINNNTFVNIIQRNLDWPSKKPKTYKNGLSVLIDENLCEGLADTIFFSMFPDLGPSFLATVDVVDSSDLKFRGYCHKFIFDFDSKWKKKQLRGENVDMSQMHGKKIKTIFDGNQRSNMLYLMFRGNFTTDGKSKKSYMLMNIGEIYNNVVNIATKSDLSLITEEQIKYTYTDENDKLIENIGFFNITKDGEKIKIDIRTDTFSIFHYHKTIENDDSLFRGKLRKEIRRKFDTIQYCVNDEMLNHISDSIIDKFSYFYDRFKNFEITMKEYDNPTIVQIHQLFKRYNTQGVNVSDIDLIFSSVTATNSNIFDYDIRKRLLGTLINIHKNFSSITQNFTIEDLFCNFYYITNETNNAPSTSKTILKNLDSNVILKMSSNYEYLETVLYRTLNLMKHVNIWYSINKSDIVFRILLRKVKYLSDVHKGDSEWTISSVFYNELICDVIKFVITFFYREAHRHSNLYDSYTTIINEGKKLSENTIVNPLTEEEIDVVIKSSKMNKAITAFTSPEMNSDFKIQLEHIFPQKYSEEKGKDFNVIPNLILMPSTENQIKSFKTPGEFFSKRDNSFRKKYHSYIVGINQDGEIEDDLNDIDFYDRWLEIQTKLKKDRIKKILFNN
jgi:hypothetical protein